jgi:O-methyltransferase involved in polyketide biosynthesis
MNKPNPHVRGISDTDRWVAYFRARETQRSDALFHDSYAERLTGERGLQIANTVRERNKQECAWVAQTYLVDKLLSREIKEGDEANVKPRGRSRCHAVPYAAVSNCSVGGNGVERT